MDETAGESSRAPDKYVSTLTRAEVARLRRWHESSYQASRRGITHPRIFEFRDLTLNVPSQVMPVTDLTELLASAVTQEVRRTDRVLDMGTGCGVHAILAAHKSRHVVAADINPEAVKSARQNVVLNGVADRVQMVHSDLFDAIMGRFDLIIYNPPSRWFAPRDLLEAASADENYSGLIRFMKALDTHLHDDGRLILFFGTTGDIDFLKRLILTHGLVAQVVGEKTSMKEGIQVHYFTFLVRRQRPGPVASPD